VSGAVITQAVGDLGWGHGGPQNPLAGVVGRFDLAEPEREGQELIFGPPELVLDDLGQFAECRGVEDILEVALQGAPLCGDGRGGDLSELGQLPAADEGLGDRDARELAGGHSLPQHGTPEVG